MVNYWITDYTYTTIEGEIIFEPNVLVIDSSMSHWWPHIAKLPIGSLSFASLALYTHTIDDILPELKVANHEYFTMTDHKGTESLILRSEAIKQYGYSIIYKNCKTESIHNIYTETITNMHSHNPVNCYIKNIYFENTQLPKEFTQNNGSSADHLFFSDRRIYNIYINNIHCKYSYSLMEYDLRTIISSNQTIFEAKLEASEKKTQRLESKLSKIFEFLELADDCLDIEDQNKDIKIKGLMKEVARLKKNSKK
jgi:hypothetical protein